MINILLSELNDEKSTLKYKLESLTNSKIEINNQSYKVILDSQSEKLGGISAEILNFKKSFENCEKTYKTYLEKFEKMQIEHNTIVNNYESKRIEKIEDSLNNFMINLTKIFRSLSFHEDQFEQFYKIFNLDYKKNIIRMITSDKKIESEKENEIPNRNIFDSQAVKSFLFRPNEEFHELLKKINEMESKINIIEEKCKKNIESQVNNLNNSNYLMKSASTKIEMQKSSEKLNASLTSIQRIQKDFEISKLQEILSNFSEQVINKFEQLEKTIQDMKVDRHNLQINIFKSFCKSCGGLRSN